MNVKLLVTIDAEENWEKPGSTADFDVSNIYEIPRLQAEYFDRFNIKPVYLLTYPVVTDSKCIEIFRRLQKDGKCEIGAHLHHWNTPPYTKRDIFKKPHQFKLPYEIEKQKIKDLTDFIEKNIKVRAVTFRAGRWGADGETIKILSELGYKIDISVIPLTDYTNEGGMNFYDAPFEPYFPSFANILHWGENRNILEIPTTCGFSRRNFEGMKKIYTTLRRKPFLKLHAIGVLYRLHVLRLLKLSPEQSNFAEMKQLVDLCLLRKHEVLHLTFHSSMNSIGHSPYSKTKKEKEARMRNLQKILHYIVDIKKVKSYTAKEYYEWYIQNNS